MVDTNRLWQEACERLKGRVSEKDLEVWIMELGTRSFDGNLLVLEAPFGLFRDRVMQSFVPAITTAVSEVARTSCTVQVVVGSTKPATTRPHSRTVRRRDGRSSAPAASGDVTERSFSSFIVGESNRMAYLGARQLVEEGLTEGGNPLFLYGNVGLGKTHLLTAIRNALRARGEKVLYFQGEDFTRRMVEALQARTMDRFHRELTSCDAIILDDVQFIAGKKRTQEECYHTFNTLQQLGKPIALACDRHPDELTELVQGLASRFEGGLLCELGALDAKLRLSILNTKLAEANVIIDPHLVERIATQLSGSVREIEGLVTRFRAAAVEGSPVLHANTVDTMVAPYIPRRRPVNLTTVIDTVAQAHNLTREELLSRDRARRVAWPRHMAAYFCRKLTRASLPEIGEALGGRNHTSILRAVRAVATRERADVAFTITLKQIEKLIGASV